MAVLGNATVNPEEMQFGSHEAFGELLSSKEKPVHDWAEHWRDAFNAIRNSPDPILREYYHKRIAYASAHGSIAVQKKGQKNLKRFLKKTEVTIKRSWSRTHGYEPPYFSAGKYVIVLGLTFLGECGVSLQTNDKVDVRFDLTATRHPKCFATQAQPSDPASRLRVSITGCDKTGPFHFWYHCDAPHWVRKMNSMVDELEGLSLDEIAMLDMRWVRRREMRDGKSVMVTRNT